VITQIQESNTPPEISLLFYNGSLHMFKKGIEERIDGIIQNHFIEYLKEDLSVHTPDTNGYQSMAGGLLGGEDKVGVARLIEALQCCMWTSMLKKKVPPPPSHNGVQPIQAPDAYTNPVINSSSERVEEIKKEEPNK
jgi:hypothetical protein